MRSYRSETDKVRDLPQVMQYIQGKVLDVACGDDKIIPEAIGVDGRDLPGVNIITDDLITLWDENSSAGRGFDVVYSSHFLEHASEPAYLIQCWSNCLKQGGHLIIYMPDKRHYDNKENLEHLYDWSYEDFLFMFKRVLCGEGKNFKGNNLPQVFELIDSGMDVRKDCYSFYIIAKKV